MKPHFMKTLTSIIIVLLALTGCNNISFSTTGTHSKATVEVNASDGTYAETHALGASKGNVIKIESSLEKGQLKIELQEVENIARADEIENYVLIDVVKEFTIAPGDDVEFVYDRNSDFLFAMTAIGETQGKIEISVIK